MYESILRELGEAHNALTINEMRAFERSQAAIYNGAPVHSTLEQLEQWVQKLAEILWKTLRQLLSIEQLRLVYKKIRKKVIFQLIFFIL